MKRLLTFIAVVMMSLMAFNTALADAREDLLAAVKAENDACPQGDDDVMLNSIKVEGDNLVFTFVVAVSKTELDMLKSIENDVTKEMVADLRSDDKFKQLFDLCKTAKCNLTIRFANDKNQYVDLILPKSKL